jgi:hypothetical protein
MFVDEAPYRPGPCGDYVRSDGHQKVDGHLAVFPVNDRAAVGLEEVETA